MGGYFASAHQRNLRQRWSLGLAVVAGISCAVPAAFAQDQDVCNPNTEVCTESYTHISTQQHQGGSGSARIAFYSVPKEKGPRKGISLWVFGFGDPKPAEECLEKGPASGKRAISEGVPLPVRLGFDHYTVDFCDPTDYLQRNAAVVRELIHHARFVSRCCSLRWEHLGC